MKLPRLAVMCSVPILLLTACAPTMVKVDLDPQGTSKGFVEFHCAANICAKYSISETRNGQRVAIASTPDPGARILVSTRPGTHTFFINDSIEVSVAVSEGMTIPVNVYCVSLVVAIDQTTGARSVGNPKMAVDIGAPYR